MDGAVVCYGYSRVPPRGGVAWGDLWRVHGDFSNRGAEWAGVSRASWAVPCTVSGAEPLSDVSRVLAYVTRRPYVVQSRRDLS